MSDPNFAVGPHAICVKNFARLEAKCDSILATLATERDAWRKLETEILGQSNRWKTVSEGLVKALNHYLNEEDDIAYAAIAAFNDACQKEPK